MITRTVLAKTVTEKYRVERRDWKGTWHQCAGSTSATYSKALKLAMNYSSAAPSVRMRILRIETVVHRAVEAEFGG